MIYQVSISRWLFENEIKFIMYIVKMVACAHSQHSTVGCSAVDRHFEKYFTSCFPFRRKNSNENSDKKLNVYKRRSSTVSQRLYRFRRYTDPNFDSIDTKSTWTLFVAMQSIQRRIESHSRNNNNNIMYPHRCFIQALTLTEFKFEQRLDLIRF